MRYLLFATAAYIFVASVPAYASDDNAQLSAVDKDQIIKCRKVEVTGSLLKKGKVCRTAAEWRKIQENGNRTARAVVEEGAKPTN